MLPQLVPIDAQLAHGCGGGAKPRKYQREKADCQFSRFLFSKAYPALLSSTNTCNERPVGPGPPSHPLKGYKIAHEATAYAAKYHVLDGLDTRKGRQASFEKRIWSHREAHRQASGRFVRGCGQALVATSGAHASVRDMLGACNTMAAPARAAHRNEAWQAFKASPVGRRLQRAGLELLQNPVVETPGTTPPGAPPGVTGAHAEATPLVTQAPPVGLVTDLAGPDSLDMQKTFRHLFVATAVAACRTPSAGIPHALPGNHCIPSRTFATVCAVLLHQTHATDGALDATMLRRHIRAFGRLAEGRREELERLSLRDALAADATHIHYMRAWTRMAVAPDVLHSTSALEDADEAYDEASSDSDANSGPPSSPSDSESGDLLPDLPRLTPPGPRDDPPERQRGIQSDSDIVSSIPITREHGDASGGHEDDAAEAEWSMPEYDDYTQSHSGTLLHDPPTDSGVPKATELLARDRYPAHVESLMPPSQPPIQPPLTVSFGRPLFHPCTP